MRQPSRLKSLQYRLEAMVLRLAVFLFRLIPLDAASAVMGFSWKWFAPMNARHKRALEHLEQALPETNEAERRRILSGMWENLGRVTAETFFIDQLLLQDARFEVVADELTRKVLQGGEPCVFVSLHSGNWEMCVQPAVRAGLEISGVYQALKNPVADDVLRAMRSGLYSGGLLSKGHQTARKLIGALRRGHVVAIMGDLRETRGIKVPFFGRMAYANPIPASLARNTNVPIVLGRVIRKEGVRFIVEGRGLTVPVTNDKEADIAAVTVEIHRVFEEWIREHPEQWMWIHRKWARA